MNAAKPRMPCRPMRSRLCSRWNRFPCPTLAAANAGEDVVEKRMGVAGGDLPYCANIAASCLWQCVLLLLHSSRQARALHIFNASHKKRRAVSRRPVLAREREEIQGADAAAAAATALPWPTHFSNFKAE